MLDTNVTFRDLGLLTVFFVIVVAGVFLIRALVHLGGAMRDVKRLIKNNADGINKTIKNLPAISANVASLTEYASEVTDNLRNEQELIDSALENICDTIESVSDTARAINEDFLGSIKRLAGGIMTLVRFITKKKPAEGQAAASGKKAGDGGSGGGRSGGVGGGGSGGSDGSDTHNESGGSKDNAGGSIEIDAGGGGDYVFGSPQAVDNKPEKRERKKKKTRMRSAAVVARKKQADKARSINIHIR